MSLHPQSIPPIPSDTARIARAAFPKGSTFMRMRDELGVFYRDEDFSDLFPARGQSAMSPWRLALVTIMQFTEGLTDRQAADAVRGRMDWKYALSLELTDPGFNFSVLSEFRSRLVKGEAQERLLQLMLDTFKEKGLLKAGGKQRTDSTHVLAAVRVLHRIERVGETLRAALNEVAAVASDPLASLVSADWFERYTHRVELYRLPKSLEERMAYVKRVGADGFYLLEALYSQDSHAQLDPK